MVAHKTDRQGNLYTGPNTEDTPTLVEATAFRGGIVVAQMNEIVERVPRVDIPGDWVDAVVPTTRPYAIEPLFTRDPAKVREDGSDGLPRMHAWSCPVIMPVAGMSPTLSICTSAACRSRDRPDRAASPISSHSTARSLIRRSLRRSRSRLSISQTTETATYFAGTGEVTDTYTGVSLWTLIRDAGLLTDPSVKNDLLRYGVVATGSDGSAR